MEGAGLRLIAFGLGSVAEYERREVDSLADSVHVDGVLDIEFARPNPSRHVAGSAPNPSTPVIPPTGSSTASVLADIHGEPSPDVLPSMSFLSGVLGGEVSAMRSTRLAGEDVGAGHAIDVGALRAAVRANVVLPMRLSHFELREGFNSADVGDDSVFEVSGEQA